LQEAGAVAEALGADVNTVAPGWIRSSDTTATLERYKALIPAGRLGEPVDVAEVVRFLASPAAGFVIGQLMYVNGGMVLGS
jgi:3-oxoacyl-[acyl-carrier protein] reductase